MNDTLVKALTNMKWESDTAIQIVTIVMDKVTLWLGMGIIGAIIFGVICLYIFKDRIFKKNESNIK